MNPDDLGDTHGHAPSLQQRVEMLETIAALHALKARYAAAADAKYTACAERSPKDVFARAARAQADCFMPEGVWEGGTFGGHLVGREALYENFLRAPWRYAIHFYQSPCLELQGNVASGQWLLWQLAVRDPEGEVVLLGGRTHESYRRTDEGWLIERMRFESLHSVVIARDSHALVQMTAGDFPPIPGAFELARRLSPVNPSSSNL